MYNMGGINTCMYDALNNYRDEVAALSAAASLRCVCQLIWNWDGVAVRGPAAGVR
jgi:hypothetical protein